MRGQKSSPGDTRIAKNKYHYTCTSDGWVLTHRLMAKEILGREIRADERVRFKDGNRTNLHKSNLEVFRVKTKTREVKIALLETKRDEIDMQIKELRNDM